MLMDDNHTNPLMKNLGAQFFRTIADQSDIGIAVIDTHGHFIYYNKMMKEIEGLNDEDMTGKYIFDIFPSYTKQTSSIYKCLRTKKPIYDDIQTYINFKGKKITSVVTDLPIIEDGRIIGVIELVKDSEKIKNLYESYKNLFTNSVIPSEKSYINANNAYYHFDDFITDNKDMIELIQRIKKISQFGSNTLIYGETGTGKEIIAQSIHNFGVRRSKSFIAQNCAAIPDNLLESTLFGTTRGSFTGATNLKGLFEQANGGTLLLDELNSLPISLQAKLLRVLQESRIRRIGDTSDRIVDVHVIATINEPPEALIKQNKLRQDLFFRLNTMNIVIPPLRERPEDINLLLDYFTEKKSAAFEVSQPRYSTEVLDFFHRYKWSGNVRELSNVVEYILINSEYNGEVKPQHLPHYLYKIYKKEYGEQEVKYASYTDAINSHEAQIIYKALEKNSWNISRTARDLSIKRQTLYNKIKKFNINRKDDNQ